VRVKLTQKARADLVEIAKWIAKDNPNRAVSLVLDLREAFRALRDFPEAYPLALTKDDVTIRRKIVGNYLIFFTIMGKQIEILHVLNGARDWEVLLS
jgi:toxin ParE1/3/4